MAEADLAQLDDEYVVEPKIDGWRCLAEMADGKVTLKSRRGTHLPVPAMEAALTGLPLDCVLDGELCYVDERGVSSLPALLGQDGELRYYVFDVLAIEGADVTGLELHKRRRLLEMLIDERLIPTFVEVVPQLPGSHAVALFAEYTAIGGEGVVVKERDSTYHTDSRHSSWRKCKPNNQD